MPRLSKIGAAALAAFGWTGLSSVNADVLVVAGGGGGGGIFATYGGGGGGGAGGYRTGTVSLNPTLSYTVTVGAGGSAGTSAPAKGGNGNDSVFSTITSTGGGGAGSGGVGTVTGNNGGSGGGAANDGTNPNAGGSGNTPATSPSQGNNGGSTTSPYSPNFAGAGGGGASAVGANSTSTTGGNGGAGTASSITGSSVTYAGGGGGGTYNGGTVGTGGAGGGGNAGTTGGNNNGNSGTANLGGGGGGGSASTGASNGGQGGSGVVIISYPSPQKFGGGVVTSSGGNTIHTFTTSGTLSPLSALTASTLVVAGGAGGGGGSGQYGCGGGGGAGGYRTSTLTIDTNSIYTVTVGAGGAGGTGSTNPGNGTKGTSGSNSIFYSNTANGGGGGGAASASDTGGITGGSGGGGGAISGTGASGDTPSTSPSQGNSGANSSSNDGGGGGGSAGAGSTVNGGTATSNSITGSSVYYAGGGGASANNASTGGLGGGTSTASQKGGAGDGGAGTPSTPTPRPGGAGTANTGGGGGGGGNTGAGGAGGSGGSGVVIISYPGSTQQMAGGTVTVAGGNVIHTFTSSGYLTPIVLVNNSLRFRSSASASLSRTPTVASNRTTWTWSGWVKRAEITTTERTFFGAGTDGNNFTALAWINDGLYFQNYTSGTQTITNTTAVFRDPSAWYHIVLAIDTTQATAANRAKIYVNGVQQAGFSGTPFSSSQQFWINFTYTHRIGSRQLSSADSFSEQYMTDINFIDGQALTPNSFGTTSDLGVWQPIRYGGSYGTNGFYLPFPSSSVTANYLVVAGGGGGGAGGAGAGGLLTGTTSLNSATSYTVTVGAGGTIGNLTTTGGNGGDSVFNAITSTGGGGGAGGGGPTAGASGGSGGGGTNTGAGGAGTSGQGNAGGAGYTDFASYGLGGGGGGASAAGGSAASGVAGGNGGAGTASSITGSSITYAGGGGGGGSNAGSGYPAGTGGSGGGGNGNSNGSGSSAAANTGGGGGGAGSSGNGGLGGSGIVIVSYAGTQKFTGGTITSAGGNTIHTFTTSGTLTSNIFNDFSPNGNNWTGNNINVSTLGSTYDSMTDVPTLTSATAANYCVWNAVDNANGEVTLKNANLEATRTSASNDWAAARGTMFVSSGKWYFEMLSGMPTAGFYTMGVANASLDLTGDPKSSSNAWVVYLNDGDKYNGSGSAYGSGSSATTDVFQCALDLDNGKIWWGKNGTFFASGDPAAGTNAAFTNLSGQTLAPVAGVYGSSSSNGAIINFGQQPFAYTPPTGFNRLNTFNLPTPTIGATAATTANKYMNIALYTGTGSSQSITGLGFQPDWTWIKERNAAADHGLYDAVRGVQIQLESNNNGAETTETTGLTAFGSDGFTVGALAQLNTSADTYVAWNWKANGAGSSNTDGTITSTVSANTTAGFSIVTYTGTGSNATVGHGLGVAPSMIICRTRDVAGNPWATYHVSIGNTKAIYLNLTNAPDTNSGFWNNTSPTSTVFSVGTLGDVNQSTKLQLAYCFAQVAGYSAFGSYTGNGSSDGPFIFTGFRPRFVMFKGSSIASNWCMLDSSRNTYNLTDATLQANDSAAELTNLSDVDFLSNGIKIRDVVTNDTNVSGQTYIYMVFAEVPLKFSNAR
jgi:hypothetical protein